MHLRRKPLLVLSLLAALLALPACGGGGGGSSTLQAGGTTGLSVLTASLPGGMVDHTYPTTQLAAANAQGTPQWSLQTGSLPPGLDLDPSGVLSGTPTQAGSWTFTVRVDDSTDSATRDLVVGVDVLALAATGGLTAGDAWTQRPVTLSASGATSTVTFSVVSNESGGSFTSTDGSAATATWLPGSTGGAGIVDRLRVSGESGGASADLDLPVMSDPTETQTASFGTTDVWYIDPGLKKGSHAYDTDFHAALADTGLRDPASTGPVGTTADQLADLWMRVELLRQINPLFLRNADGTAGTGLPISFALHEPGAGYSKATPGNSLQGSPTHYSVMALIHGSNDGIVGTAFLDGPDNAWHENDTTSASLELGVFLDQITGIFNNAYGNTLPFAPVGASDVPALKALLYGLSNPGGRYGQIAYVGHGLARTLAAVCAHEIGHSLSLDHTDPPQQGSIMNPSASVSPSATYAFIPANVTRLQAALPGAGKTTGGQQAQKPGSPPPLGVRVCNCRAHAGTATSR
jgi:hypothetical protein